MEIVKLKPVFKDYLWGGHKLANDYNKNSNLDIIAESWEVSCHPDGESVIANGIDEGLTLTELLRNSKNKYISSSFDEKDQFPILIKLIDSLQSLSIQVHPSDEYALEHEHELGKSEMWYILDAEDGAFIYYGVNQKVTKQQFRKAIEDNTVLDLLNKVYVKKGDCFFIEAGTIHAIGAGIVICEIQENSNSTYRVYDFNRRDKSGKLRPLHIDKALDVVNLEPLETSQNVKYSTRFNGYSAKELYSCKYFSTYKYDVFENVTLCADNESFNAIIVIDGSGKITAKNMSLDIIKGDSFFIPAGFCNYKIEGTLSFIKVEL